MLTIQTKICTKCGIERDIKLFAKRKSVKSGYRKECKQCINLYSRVYHDKNKEHLNKKRMDIRLKNIDRHRRWAREWALKNRGQHKAYVKKNKERIYCLNKIQRDNLSDGYIATVLSSIKGLDRKDIIMNKEIIKAKRMLLELKRAIKNYDKK
jgi:hypothetical protein